MGILVVILAAAIIAIALTYIFFGDTSTGGGSLGPGKPAGWVPPCECKCKCHVD